MTNSSCSEEIIFAVGLSVSLIDAASIIPIYVLVIHLVVEKWLQQRSFRTASHADIFTIHAAALRLIWVFALGFYINALISYTGPSGREAYALLTVTWYGENFIHVLTCVEQYLAVVHPIVYRRLRNVRGVKIRNISLGCVWVLSPVCSGVANYKFTYEFPFLFLTPFAVCLVVVSFCCVSTLCVLIRPGPGEGGRVDQSKQRAFYTITAILVMLWVWLGGIVLTYALNSFPNVSEVARCMLMTCLCVFNIPSGLIIPVLYLHRAGKLSFCFHKKG